MAREKLDASAYRRMTDAIAPRIEGRSRQLELLLYASIVVVTWWTRFVQDDAFISFRYSRNLAQGHGLVYNPGERVEGYTNFLWTVFMWIPEHFGWNTPLFSVLVNIPLTVITVALALRFARKVFVDNEPLALLAAAALAANMTFIGYGTSGLETMMQTLFITAVALLLVPHGGEVASTTWQRIGAGVLGAFAILTRIDSVVLIGAWFLVHVWWMLRRRGDDPKQVVIAALQLGVPLLAVVLPWFAWKHDYYDAFLPNTLQAKEWTNWWVPILFGLMYLTLFFATFAAFLLIGRWRRLKGTFPAPHATWALVAVVVAWFAYICFVGADFMEFRFVVPVIPILALPAAYLVDHYRTPRRQVALIAILLAVSLGHRLAPPLFPYPVLTFEELKHWPEDDANDWETMGNLFHDKFPGGVDAPGQPVIGILPAGAIPYYAELPTIDMFGLNDEWVAKNGLLYPIYFPGHVRTATLDYLERRDVSLLIGSVRQSPIDPDRTEYRLSEMLDLIPAGDLNNLPDDAQVLEIPFNEFNAWRMVYLEPNEKLDRVIEEEGWKLFPIERVCEEQDIVDTFRSFIERTCPGGREPAPRS